MLNVIISHDVDHLSPWEHKKDLIIPKFLLRGIIECAGGYISPREFFLRLKSLFVNNWQNIEELMNFDRKNCIPSTFFIGMKNGSGLSYSLNQANYWIKRILENGFDIGVHGIEHRELSGIKKELEIFRSITGMSKVGIRIHYMRMEHYTIKLLEQAGYLFDTSIYGLQDCFKYGKIWEFPLHIMDRMFLLSKRKWVCEPIEVIMKKTYSVVESVISKKIRYLTILFHDYYFNDMFSTWKTWYINLIAHLRSLKVNFLDYKMAIREMERI